MHTVRMAGKTTTIRLKTRYHTHIHTPTNPTNKAKSQPIKKVGRDNAPPQNTHTDSPITLCRMATLTQQQMSAMIASATSADKVADRKYEAKDYITIPAIEQLVIKQDDKCLYCTGPFDHEAPNRQWPDAPTLERLDEALAHTSDNCILACYYCNCARSGKTVSEMKEYAMCMKLGWIKYCNGCKVFFEDTDNAFGKNRHTHDGLLDICRFCANSRNKAHQTRNKRRTKHINTREGIEKLKTFVKYCRTCATTFEDASSAFAKDAGRGDGFRPTCKACHNSRAKELRAAKRQRVQQSAQADVKDVSKAVQAIVLKKTPNQPIEPPDDIPAVALKQAVPHMGIEAPVPTAAMKPAELREESKATKQKKRMLQRDNDKYQSDAKEGQTQRNRKPDNPTLTPDQMQTMVQASRCTDKKAYYRSPKQSPRPETTSTKEDDPLNNNAPLETPKADTLAVALKPAEETKETKRCSRCSTTYDDIAASFFSDKRRKDGYHPVCMVCTRARARENRAAQDLKYPTRAQEATRIDAEQVASGYHDPFPLRF